MSPVQLIVHGHFYQPPRENPWTGSIEPQESAAPYRDWNQRITAECYRPNTRSRVLDGAGRVLDVVNNFAWFSYNFGPTLLGDLEERDPDTYRRILEADAESIRRLGHGNAMAQAYNHTILPLSSPRDRRTQIRWGLADFLARFRRRAEGMWLAECAVDPATLDDLAAAGVGFVLLAPSQAAAVRGPGARAWRDVADGSIATDRAYRCSTRQGPITILFYHEGISRAVAFESLLHHAGGYAERVEAAAAASDQEHPLVLVCSDGESYGHHEPMGDMCFAYLATREAPARGIALTNPARYLADHPPAWEVRIKGGEGTAWSCAHGVGRWARDCGCSTGGAAGWNQAWRTPLREGFDRLREAIDPLFEREGRELLRDPWAARDDYVEVLLGRPVGAAQAFVDKHARGPLDDDARARLYRLMEMQRFGMYMYTSCGWFFSELSGIETVQNMRYARRAAQLAEMLAGGPVDAAMNRALARARSNIASKGTALDIIARQVHPSILSPEKVAAHHAMEALVDPPEPTDRLYDFRIQVHAQSRAGANGFDAYCCRMTVAADRTAEGGSFEAGVILGSELRLCAFVRPYDPSVPPIGPADLLARVEREGFDQAAGHWARVYRLSFSLADMLLELRLRAVAVLLGPLLEELDRTFESIFQSHQGLLRTLVPLQIPLPRGLRAPVGYAGGRRFNRLVERSLEHDDLERAAKLAGLLEELEVAFDRRPAARMVSGRAREMLAEILERPAPEGIGELVRLLDDAGRLSLTLDEASLQDAMMERLPALLENDPDPATARALVGLAARLNLNTDAWEKRVE